jgi:hypothetical protein
MDGAIVDHAQYISRAWSSPVQHMVTWHGERDQQGRARAEKGILFYTISSFYQTILNLQIPIPLVSQPIDSTSACTGSIIVAKRLHHQTSRVWGDSDQEENMVVVFRSGGLAAKDARPRSSI